MANVFCARLAALTASGAVAQNILPMPLDTSHSPVVNPSSDGAALVGDGPAALSFVILVSLLSSNLQFKF